MKTLLAITLPESVGGRILFGLETALVGILIVFAVLLLLMVVIYLFQLFSYTIPNRSKKAAEKKPAPAGIVPPQNTVLPERKDDTELIAVLSAAVAAYLSENDPGSAASSKYRIRSFRRLK